MRHRHQAKENLVGFTIHLTTDYTDFHCYQHNEITEQNRLQSIHLPSQT